jgi:NAD(P)-dependent dehydrogenase (short-subunit alcohol dehydrogenase family)
MEMNAFGTFNVTRLAAAEIAGNEPDEHGQRGVVVNTSSIAGIEGQTGQLAYAAAKAAILGMTLPLARDLAVLGIRVCAIAPGTMGTPIMLGVPEEMQARLVQSIVFPKRMGRPEEFALLVESIARNPYLNGENIRLDGALRFPPR